MKRGIILGVLLILSMSLVFAASCPTAPKTYIGNVDYKGNPLVGDYEIRAMISGHVVGINVVNAGYYSIDVYPGCYSGDVSFFISGVKANENGSANDFGTQGQLDLTLNQIPLQTGTVCGNSILDLGEECDGNNFGTAKCNNGYLFCNSNCIIDYTNCVSTSQNQQSSSSNENNTIITNQTISTQNNGGGITGGVIGVLGGNNIYYFAGALIIIIVGIIIAVSRKGKKNKESPEITIE